MLPTSRLALLLGLAALPMLAAPMAPWGAGLGAALDLALVALAAVDLALAPGPSQVEVRRRVRRRLSVGTANPVDLELRNRSARPLRARVADDHPPEFASEDARPRVEVPPHGARRVRYHLTPPRRGDFAFGDVHLLAEGPLGLVHRRLRLAAAAPTRVYPNLIGLARFELASRRAMTRELGLRAVRRVGRGDEFEKLRDYLPDDEYRDIDWKATARRGRPVSRVYQVERSQQVVVLLDGGRSMVADVEEGRHGPASGMTRMDAAVNAALMLAYVAGRHGDRVGLGVFVDGLRRWLPPRRGRGVFHRFTETLYAVRAALEYVDYRESFRDVVLRVRRRSLVVVLTDPVDEDAAGALASAVGVLRRAHVPLVVCFHDPGLLEAARSVPARPEDAYRQTVAQELVAERRRLAARMQRGGVHLVEATALDLAAELVNKYLELKATRRF
ncbi:MAG: DUF58 domain-containing protein [Planctomycetes bacterium]|nr:DUF58 domain-containing protein [Planctomycetota bacterium]